jgi:hypothetical protein
VGHGAKPPKPPKAPPCEKCLRRAVHDRRCAAERAAATEKRREKRREEREANRLPHGSAFAVAWDADRHEWSGTLSVPGYELFSGSAEAVFWLLKDLDLKYRAAVRRRAGSLKAQGVA